ncbi:MAG: RecX family transcriptional regulator [Clostridia bacterium]|nr:RecX family transcriptional regulator [Clostridia bacterium]
MLITSITPSRRKRKYDLVVDGEFFATIDEQTLLDYRVLEKGNEIDRDLLLEIVEDSARASAYSDAIAYISSAMRTVKEVEGKLYRLGYTTIVVEEAIRRITGYGYLDDRDYATRYVDMSRETKGKVRIRHELRAKGICEDIVEEALIDFDEYAPATREAERYSHRVGGDKKKIFNHLVVRGYSTSVASEVVSSISGEDEYD